LLSVAKVVAEEVLAAMIGNSTEKQDWFRSSLTFWHTSRLLKSHSER
jgi:hypothetical protein